MENRKVTGYKTLSTLDLTELNEEANRLIQLETGWEPYKRIQALSIAAKQSISPIIFYTQTMVQYARSEKDTITNNELPFDLIDSESIISSEEYNGMQEELLDFEKGCKGNNDIGGEIQRLINQEGYEAMDKVVLDSLKDRKET